MADNRFARTAAEIAALQDARAAALEAEVQRFALPEGDEAALDVGCGAGALAIALAPHVASVIGVDPVPELLALARERAPANATFVEGDGTALEFEDGRFDLVGTLRTLHHVARPELLVSELSRVTRPGGRALVVDQLGPVDPLEALAVDRFEQARDPGHARLLPDVDLRALLEAYGLVLLRSRQTEEQRRLDAYLDLAGCAGEERARALSLAPHGDAVYTAHVGWYLLERRYSWRA